MTKENRNFQPRSQGPLLLVPPTLSTLSFSGARVGEDPGNEAGNTVAEFLSSHEQPLVQRLWWREGTTQSTSQVVLYDWIGNGRFLSTWDKITCSLWSKRSQSSYDANVGARAKEMEDRRGWGSRKEYSQPHFLDELARKRLIRRLDKMPRTRTVLENLKVTLAKRRRNPYAKCRKTWSTDNAIRKAYWFCR